MSTEQAPASSEGSKTPSWLNAQLFDGFLKETLTGYQQIKQFKAYPAMSAGENYATIMLRIEIEVELTDGKTKCMSYMIKLPQESERFRQMMRSHNLFDIETQMYKNVVPEFEQMYRDAGVEIQFGAKYYDLETPSEFGVILLEDLRPRGFKNANRLEGLDMEHIKCVLTRLAQWHAASATRVAVKGKYPEILTTGFFREQQRELMAQMNELMSRPIRKSMKTYEGNEVYIATVEKLYSHITDELYRASKPDPNEFNVLNHGDCWSNNVMFQYDAFGKIKETYLVDYQIPKYGTPAQDLYYFLLSSAKYELKLKQFEYFIKYYHDILVESLTLLKYPKKIPSLKEIHMALYKYGIWGFSTASGVMAVVLLEPTETANVENFISDNADGADFRTLMFTNDRYRKHIEMILPWLYNRGALEC